MARERKGSRELCARAQSFQDRLGQALAALAGKWKCLHDDRADFPFHILAQHGAGAVQSGFHGLRLQFENLRGLLDIHPLDYASDENDAKRIGEFVDRVLDDVLNFTLCHGFFRVLGCGREGKLDDLASRVPGGSDVHSTVERRRRNRPKASLIAIRPSQVARLESPRKSCRCVNART